MASSWPSPTVASSWPSPTVASSCSFLTAADIALNSASFCLISCVLALMSARTLSSSSSICLLVFSAFNFPFSNATFSSFNILFSSSSRFRSSSAFCILWACASFEAVACSVSVRSRSISCLSSSACARSRSFSCFSSSARASSCSFSCFSISACVRSRSSSFFSSSICALSLFCSSAFSCKETELSLVSTWTINPKERILSL